MMRWTTLCSLLVAFLGVDSAVASVGPFGDRAVVKAREALDVGDDARALLNLQDALARLPAGGEMAAHARFLAARAAINLDLHRRALDHLEGIEDALPEVRDFVWYLRGVAYRGVGDWQRASSEWRRLVAYEWSSPLCPNAQFSLADAWIALGRHEAAAAQLDLVLERYARHDRAGTARFLRAEVAERLRDWEKAGELYRDIAFRDPLDYFADESMRRFERLSARRRIEPAGFYDYLGRADRLLSARALDPARVQLDAIEKWATSSSRRDSLAERRAKLAYREERFADAETLYRGLAERTSGARRIRQLQWLSRSLAAQQRFDEAVDIYDGLAGEYAGDHRGRELLFKAAWLAYNGGDYTRSLKLFRSFVERYGDDYEVDDAIWFIAWNAYRLGDHPSALQTLRALRREYPRSKLVQRSHYWEARILAAAGRHEEAARAYQTTITHDPTDYYAVYSQLRLEELAQRVHPEQPTHVTIRELSRPQVASLDDDEPSGYTTADDEEAVRPVERERRLPPGSAVFDWTTDEGRRALRLMTLGFEDEATELVRRLKSLPGIDEDTERYARARLLYSLGDYYGAFKIAAVYFREDTAGGYSPRYRETFEMLYPFAHRELVEAAQREWGLSPFLLLSVIRQESAFNDRARSWVSARGLMQIIPPTAEQIARTLQFDDFHPGLLNDPSINVRFGAWYLRALLDTYRGHPLLALGGYNAGPIAMTRWVEARSTLQTDEFVEEIPYTETRGYVKRIVANLAHYHALYGGELRLPDRLEPPDPSGIRF